MELKFVLDQIYSLKIQSDRKESSNCSIEQIESIAER